MLAGLRRLFRLTKTTVVLLNMICALGFNLLTFAFAPLASLMLAAAHRLAIQPVVAAASELATVRASEKAARQRMAQFELDRRASDTRIKRLRADLNVEQREVAKASRRSKTS